MTGNSGNGAGRRGSRWNSMVWGVAGLLLLLPWVAMRFTDEVAWTGSDFVVFGAMLAFACGAWELATRLSGNGAYRAAAAVATAAGFFLTWINLAVGIIGNENDAVNLLFAGVPVVAIVGAVIARFRAQGMVRAMLATAFVQASIAAMAVAAASVEGTLLTLCFAALWLLSAGLFRKAARSPVSAGMAP